MKIPFFNLIVVGIITMSSPVNAANDDNNQGGMSLILGVVGGIVSTFGIGTLAMNLMGRGIVADIESKLLPKIETKIEGLEGKIETQVNKIEVTIKQLKDEFTIELKNADRRLDQMELKILTIENSLNLLETNMRQEISGAANSVRRDLTVIEKTVALQTEQLKTQDNRITFLYTECLNTNKNTNKKES